LTISNFIEGLILYIFLLLIGLILNPFVHVLDEEEPGVSVSSIACACIVDVNGNKRVGSKIARGGVGASIMQMGQSSFSVGLEWTGICICA
jgi:hypothetical protein